MTVIVGLVDGPLSAGAVSLVRVASFDGTADQAVDASPGARHAAAIAASIVRHEASVAFANAAIFGERLTLAPAQLPTALAWLLERPPDVLHCSFGLATVDGELAAAFARAVAACRFVVAAAPARGRPVYPAALPGVLAVSGDARCGPDDWSWLNTAQVDFGAHVVAAHDPAVRGASAAAAHFTGLLCAKLSDAGAGASDAAVLEALRRDASWRGPERRH